MEKELFKYEVRKDKELGLPNKNIIDVDELDKKIKEAVAYPKVKKIKVVFLKNGKLGSF